MSWLFTLARLSNRSALEELREQTKALATEVNAHEKTSRAYQLAKEEAESANKAKSRYLAGLSHELRTPLNVLLGYAQLLSSDNKIPKHAKEPLQTMKRNGEYLSDLIEGVLEVSKIEAGRLSVHREDIQLRPLLEQLIDMFQQQALSKGLKFTADFPQHLPQFVSGDKQRLRQILINLISNALKFTEHGSVTFTVRYRNEVGKFIVEDTGPGISKQDQETVFHPFERVSDSNTAVSGTGLGLTISRALAELMGGDISLVSGLGEGSRFSLSLMLPRLNHIHREPVDQDKQVVGYEGESKTLLTIDDEASQRQLLSDILTPLGFTVITASSAKEGLGELKSHAIDLMFLDLKMPEISGWKAAELFRQEGFKLPIVIVSANVRELDMEDNARQNHNDYLTKPFDLRELALRCEAMSRRAGLHQTTVVSHGALSLDTRSFEVFWSSESIKVTKVGFKLLHKLLSEVPYPVSRSELIEHVWGDEPPESNALKSHIYALRKATEQVTGKPILHTISNIGYQLKGIDD